LPKGVRVGSLADAVRSGDAETRKSLAKYATDEENAFIALNTAFALDGAFIVLPERTAMQESIHVVYVSTGAEHSLLTPRNLVIVGAQSQLSFVESYVSLKDARYLTCAVTELVVGDGAIVEHDKLQNESVQAYHVSVIQAHQGRQSTVTSNAVTVGGSIVRNNVTAVLDGEGAECTLNGLSLGSGSQLIDNHTAIDHVKPHCESHELYKSILDGKAHGVFNGKIFVRKDAQKTNAKQTNKTLLLSDDAYIDTKPQLEIFADDVKCTHGATVGQLDSDQIFYLRSRGIGEDSAKDMLTLAFAADLVEKIHVDPLKELLGPLVHAKLEGGRPRS
ncbi:MAG TPA: Fe-S cluster assembly protein SufD, partial [Bacteroidota bacterium]